MANRSYRRYWRSGTAVYQTRAEYKPREDGRAAHRPPEGSAEHRTGGEETDSGGSFVYLGGAVCGDGKTEREVRRRAQAGANAWRAVEVRVYLL